MTDYNKLKVVINNRCLDKNTYYDLLLRYSDDILFQMIDKPNFQIAKELNMSGPAFSTAINFIKAYKRANNNQQSTYNINLSEVELLDSEAS